MEESLRPPINPDDLEPTWWVNDREPGMDDIWEKAGESLDEMVEKLQMHPFQADGADKLFLARYEFPKYEESFQHQDGVFLPQARGLIDFLAGFPVECVEMLGHMGERSVKEGAEGWEIQAGGGAIPPMPAQLFKGIPEERLLLNTLFFAEEIGKAMLVEGLAGEPQPAKLHWWVRTNIKDEDKFPVPGEFMGLAVRIMPGKPWGGQKSSPFIYSGHWMDTVYYTGAVVKEVIDPDEDHPYPRYKVQWRQEEEVECNPSDFAEYQVDDKVCILKAVDTDKQSQRWKDDDVEEFDKEKWIICPITFYGLDEED